eukprot:SAG31_NODE_184_length_20985_cov_28.867567_14_plen_67_part_00
MWNSGTTPSPTLSRIWNWPGIPELASSVWSKRFQILPFLFYVLLSIARLYSKYMSTVYHCNSFAGV